MILTLIGMSGIGKTFWSKRLESSGFKRFGCDEMIESKLSPELTKRGYHGIHDVAKWMGYPSDTQYAQTSNQYLQYEDSSLQEICDHIEKGVDENIVVDTTGSIVYLPHHTIERIKRISTIVYLSSTLEYADLLYQRYIEDPKPIIWGNSFRKWPFESTKHALARCYPKLLDYRTERYESMANIRIAYETHNAFGLDSQAFLNHIHDSL